MSKQITGWIWRDDQLTMKEFYKLSQQDKEEYLLLIQGLKQEERSSMDIILLNRFNIKSEQNNFFTIKEE